jgi:hypothetical protein
MTQRNSGTSADASPNTATPAKTVHFVRERDTKNTFVFAECDATGSPLERDVAVIPSLYIAKRAFPDGAPARLVVRIEPAEVA